METVKEKLKEDEEEGGRGKVKQMKKEKEVEGGAERKGGRDCK